MTTHPVKKHTDAKCFCTVISKYSHLIGCHHIEMPIPTFTANNLCRLHPQYTRFGKKLAQDIAQAAKERGILAYSVQAQGR